MRLLTKLVNTPGYTYGDGDRYELTRDAALAHALVMAMSESASLDSDSIWEYERDRVFKRANEIMREWGYVDD